MPMHIGQVIFALRRERELTQEALALAAGTNAGYISKIERGERQPSIAQLAAIAAALGSSVPALYAVLNGGKAEPPPELADETLADLSSLAVQLRQGFRLLNAENQNLVVRFVKMLGQMQSEKAAPGER